MSGAVAIVGGGAAGMLAACTAADAGAAVTVFERNRDCGVKLNLTGKGRCNLTNACDRDGLIANTPGNGRFLYSAYAALDPGAAMDFFESLGLPLKTERGSRVFPASDRARDVTEALKAGMARRGVRVVRARVREILTDDGHVRGLKTEDGAVFSADRVILATGGQSYPRTGSTGDGYAMARALGHTIVPPRPSLVPLVAEGDWPGRLEGLSLRHVTVTITREGKRLYSEFGEMIFTANGLSGPIILSASAHLGPDSFPCTLSIDLKPALDPEQLDRRVLRDFSEGRNRDFSNSLSGLAPAKLIPVLVEASGIPAGHKVHSITQAERGRLCRCLKGLALTLTGLGPFDEAVVTAGGVDVREVAPKTMMSRKVPGLYFAGEVLDVDAYTGGFNLQIAWSTGYVAGLSAARAAE